MESKVKVSVCVVTYNQERFVAACLQAIVDQVVDFPIEVLVGDDCSTDRTPQIIEEFAQKYSFIKPTFNKVNKGPYKNFIDTHNMASGEYVCHVDGDDRWLPGKLKYQVEFMDANQDFSQMWHFANKINDSGDRIGTFPSKLACYLYPSILSSKDIASSYALVGHHSTQIYRRKFREGILIGDEKLLDYWFAFNYSLGGKSYYSKKVFSEYRITAGESVTRSGSIRRATVDYLASNLLDLSSKFPDYAPYFKVNMCVRYLFSIVRGHDVAVIKSSLKKLAGVSISYRFAVKSIFFFLVQKT